MLLAVPIGMNDKAKVGLRELAVAVFEELARVGGDAVAGDGEAFKDALANDGAILIKS